MSMPEFPANVPDRETAINAILTSIAMEEAALSHIINAEGEKIQHVLACVKKEEGCCDTQKLLAINESASSMLDKVGELQILLKNKLRLVTSHLPPPCPPPCPPCPPPCPPCPPPCPPCPPPCPPCPHPCPPHPCPPPCPCVSVFSAETKYDWSKDATLRFIQETCCNDGVRYCRENCKSRIILPNHARYEIRLSLLLFGCADSKICVEVQLFHGLNSICSETICKQTERRRVLLTHSFLWETPSGHGESSLTVKLASPEHVSISEGVLEITRIKGNQ